MSPIRAQYHFRPGPYGLRAWDVRKLVRAAADLPVIQVPLAEIAELDEPYWYGPGDVPTVRSILAHARLIETADLGLPILLCEQGRVMDGMHRVAKAAHLGRVEIAALRFPVTPPPDHVGLGPDDLPYD